MNISQNAVHNIYLSDGSIGGVGVIVQKLFTKFNVRDGKYTFR